jgi:uncharacterized protein YdeI (YjbR/CyaY-like superfamily)
MSTLKRPPAGARELPLLEPRDRVELSSWLDSNHATSTGVRVAVGKKGNTVTTLTYEQAVEEALRYGWIDSTTRRLDADRYALVFTPRKPRSVWARTNKARVERLVAEGRMTPAGLAAVETAKANGSWTSVDDVEDLVVPDDLEAALAAEPAARTGFAGLSASARKLALGWIASARRPETRAKRILETTRAAAEGRRAV